ncbi:zona pellucida protein C [Halichoeres trimaculatus]|uniref:zona pellucida protein C n=1 Tax=Halichoeres trimaculatus TaxID=147232 RepID=UPI003D9E547E
MGTKGIFLCIFVGHFIAVKSVILDPDHENMFSEEFPPLFERSKPFPYMRNLDFFSDALFSSWKTWSPEFHIFPELPPVINVPNVEVFCDDSKLTILVNKRSNGVTLTGEEIWLGYDCYSNGELPNQFVFTYSLDECGTKQKIQNGNTVFSNLLHLNLKDFSNNLWRTPFPVHISCIPKRSHGNQNERVSTADSENDKTFAIRAVNSYWTDTAESNVYKRGQNINLQVSARAKPAQQLYIQSCFVSASPDPQVKPRHAVIMNKGCTAPLGSPHAVVHFEASDRANVVNFVLNSSYLISELYIHCSVIISDQGVTFGSKSCNYNVIHSRWEELSGTAEVCQCCSSKCKGLSIKHLSEDDKAIVSAGPFVIVDKEEQKMSTTPDTDSIMQSDAPYDGADTIVSGATFSRCKLPPPPDGVVMISEDPVARLSLWLPGQLQEPEHSRNLDSESNKIQRNDHPKLKSSTMDTESLLNVKTNNIEDKNWNFLTLVDGWVILPSLEEAAIAEESKRKRWFEKSGVLNLEAPQDADTVPLAEITVNVLNQDEFEMSDKMAEMQEDAAAVDQEKMNDGQVIRSKLQFSQSTDGLKTISYEEEVVKHTEARDETTTFGLDRHKGQREQGHGGMFSAFLDLLRRINRGE